MATLLDCKISFPSLERLAQFHHAEEVKAPVSVMVSLNTATLFSLNIHPGTQVDLVKILQPADQLLLFPTPFGDTVITLV